MIIKKTKPDNPSIGNGPVQNVEVEEFTRHNGVRNLIRLC